MGGAARRVVERSRSPAGEAARLLRGNLPFVVLLLAGAALRVVVCIAYRPALMLQRDAYAYLELALDPSPSPGSFRPVVYPLLFLKPLIAFDDLSLVPVAQHLVAMSLAVGLYVALRRLGVGGGVAALGLAPLLLDGYQLDIEHYVLSEALFQALVAGALLLVVLRRTRPGSGSALTTGVLVAGAGLTRFAGAVVIVPVLIYVAARRLGWRTALLIIVGFALPLAGYSAWFRNSEGTFGVTNRNGFFLYGRVASFADCAEMDPPAELRRFCFEEPPSERGPNRGIWGLVPVGRLAREPGINARLMEFSTRAILAQPLDYIAAVTGDLMRFVAPESPPEQEPYVRRWRFPRSLADADPHPLVMRYGGSAPPETGIEPFTIDRSLAGFLRHYQDVVYTRGPLIGFLIAVGLIGALFGAKAAEGRDTRAEALLFTVAGVALLLFPVMTTVYHFRYVLPTLPLLGPGAALGATALLARHAPSRRGMARSARG